MRPHFATTASTSSAISDATAILTTNAAASPPAAAIADFLAARLVHVRNRDLRALRRERLCDLFADIAPGAGDNGNLIGKLHLFNPATRRLGGRSS
jgi:hypothetical protein